MPNELHADDEAPPAGDGLHAGDVGPAAGWTTPADITRQVDRLWRQGAILKARLTGAAVFPLVLRVKAPDPRALLRTFAAVRTWVRGLEAGSRSARGFGYDITWTDINHRQLGRNRIPAGALVPTEADALRLIDRVHDTERFQTLADETLGLFPGLRDWLADRPFTVLDHADDWRRLLAVLAWFRDHPRPGLYLRQCDIPGVDSKFIEARKGLLAELLDRVLPPAAIDGQATGGRGFERRYGLLAKPALIRFRLLDERLFLHGLSDLTVPVAQFARLGLPVRRVFIAENDINGLAFPMVSEALVIFGLGYGVDRLADVAWLGDTEIHYWGDIDTHGFAILDRLRAALPHAASFLMDRATLLAHRDLWVEEGTPHRGSLSRLTVAEETLFDDLRTDRLGERIRLEQERIPFGLLGHTLAATGRPR